MRIPLFDANHQMLIILTYFRFCDFFAEYEWQWQLSNEEQYGQEDVKAVHRWLNIHMSELQQTVEQNGQTVCP